MARDFVWDFYQKRKSIWQIMEQMDEKCFSWIGAGPGEYLRSYDEALHYFTSRSSAMLALCRSSRYPRSTTMRSS